MVIILLSNPSIESINFHFYWKNTAKASCLSRAFSFGFSLALPQISVLKLISLLNYHVSHSLLWSLHRSLETAFKLPLPSALDFSVFVGILFTRLFFRLLHYIIFFLPFKIPFPSTSRFKCNRSLKSTL